jgi:hypothetical protein
VAPPGLHAVDTPRRLWDFCTGLSRCLLALAAALPDAEALRAAAEQRNTAARDLRRALARLAAAPPPAQPELEPEPEVEPPHPPHPEPEPGRVAPHALALALASADDYWHDGPPGPGPSSPEEAWEPLSPDSPWRRAVRAGKPATVHPFMRQFALLCDSSPAFPRQADGGTAHPRPSCWRGTRLARRAPPAARAGPGTRARRVCGRAGPKTRKEI